MKKIIKTVLAICLCVSVFTGISCVGNTPNPESANNNAVTEIIVDPIEPSFKSSEYISKTESDVYFIEFDTDDTGTSGNHFIIRHLQEDPITNTWSRKDYYMGSEAFIYASGEYKAPVTTNETGNKIQKIYKVHKLKNTKGQLEDQGMQALVTLLEGYFTTDRKIEEGNCFLMVDLSCVKNDANPKISGLTAMSWEKDSGMVKFNAFIDSVNKATAYDDPNNLRNEHIVK